MASEAKRQKVSDVNDLKTFKDFKVSKILAEDSETKKITLEGKLNGDDENSAVLILEKMPFKTETMHEMLEKSTLKTEFKNDIYMKFECNTEPEFNTLKANLIYPATEKHLSKYASSPIHIINETAALYEVTCNSIFSHENGLPSILICSQT